MQIKDGPFGIEYNQNEKWNEPSITLYTQKDLDDTDDFGRPNNYSGHMFIKDAWPKIRGGCSGIIEMTDGSFHIMSEDDDHYWTSLIIRQKELKDLYEGLLKFHENISTKIIRMSKVKRYPTTFKKGSFDFLNEDRTDCNPLLKISYKGKLFNSFDVSWLSELVNNFKRVLDIKKMRNIKQSIKETNQ